MALALLRDAADDGARVGGEITAVIAAIIVEDVDDRLRQGAAEIGHGLHDGPRLIVTGQDDRDARGCSSDIAGESQIHERKLLHRQPILWSSAR